METPADRGLLDMKARVLEKLLSDTAFKDNLRALLRNIDPENSPQLVRTLMGKDPEVPLAVICALPAIANCLIKAAEELFTRVSEQYPPPLLHGFVLSLLGEIDREALTRAMAGARRLADELSPVVREFIGPHEQKKRSKDRR